MTIRVLEVLATLKRAGAERMVVTLAAGLDTARFEPAVVSLFDPFPGGFETELAASGIAVEHLGKRRGFDPRIYPRLAQVIRRFRPAIVHTHSYVLRYAFPAALLAGRPRLVHTVHNVADQEVELAGRVLHRIAFRAGVVPVAVGVEVARSFKAMYGFAPPVIHNGIDLRRFRSNKEARLAWRTKHGFSAGAILVVSVARLEPQKAPLLLIHAFARAFRECRDCHLLMAGHGGLLECARALAEREAIADRVHFLGVRDDVPELLSAADVFALASRYEGHPISVIEALAAGLPVAGPSIGGLAEVVGGAGVLAASREADALACALAEAVRDRARLSQAAPQAAERFRAETMIAAYASLFERLAGGASSV